MLKKRNDYKIDDLFDPNSPNKIIKQNAYVGGIYEIEIDGIEPGCYKYLGTQDVCKNHRYVIQGDFEKLYQY